jgi:hypothetical protein
VCVNERTQYNFLNSPLQVWRYWAVRDNFEGCLCRGRRRTNTQWRGASLSFPTCLLTSGGVWYEAVLMHKVKLVVMLSSAPATDDFSTLHHADANWLTIFSWGSVFRLGLYHRIHFRTDIYVVPVDKTNFKYACSKCPHVLLKAQRDNNASNYIYPNSILQFFLRISSHLHKIFEIVYRKEIIKNMNWFWVCNNADLITI